MTMRKNIQVLVIAGTLYGLAYGKSEAELLVRLEEIQQEIGAAATTDAQKVTLKAEQHQITMELAGIEPVTSVVEEKPEALHMAVPTVIADVASVMDIKSEKIILKAKLDLVFHRFAMHHLGDHEVVLAEIMEREYANKLAAFDGASREQQQQIRAEIIGFVETARVLFFKLQLLMASPMLTQTLFGDFSIAHIDRQRLSGIFVKVLHTAYHAAPSRVDSVLVDVLSTEKIIQTSWNTPFRNKKIRRLFTITFQPSLIDLMQQVLDLEGEIEAIPTMKALQYDAFVKKFIQRADALMGELLQREASLQDCGDAAAPWVKLFVSKLILLKRTMLVRVQLARDVKHDQSRREVHVKHNLIVHDTLFHEIMSVPQLSGAAKRYESLVSRFLMGQMTSEFCCEHQELLIHLRGLVTRIVPSCSGTYAVITAGGYSLIEAFRATYTPMIPKRKGLEIYVDLLKEMIAVLEEVSKVVNNEGALFSAASSAIAGLLGDKGLLAALGPKEVQFGATMIGMTPEQLKSVLNSGSSNPKDTVMRLLAHACPVLVSKLLQSIRTRDTVGSMLADAKSGEIAKVSSGTALEAQIKNNPELIEQIEANVPGLMDSLVGRVQAGL